MYLSTQIHTHCTCDIYCTHVYYTCTCTCTLHEHGIYNVIYTCTCTCLYKCVYTFVCKYSMYHMVHTIFTYKYMYMNIHVHVQCTYM